MNRKMTCEAPSTISYQYDIFSTVGRILTSSLDPQEVFQRVMTVIGEFFAPRHWSLLLQDEVTGQLRFEIVMGLDPEKMSNVVLMPGEGIAGWVCQHGEPLVIEDVQRDRRFSSRVDNLLGFTTQSVVCVPIVNGRNKVIGAIELINEISPDRPAMGTGDIFTDVALLTSIGVFTGIAAENAFLHQKIVDLAMVDALTGLYNRLYFNEAFEREVDRVRRHGRTACVLLADVDRFKEINDTFGHLVGDKALRAVADILKASVRKSDIVARFGGDEFVILMPLSDEAKGRVLAERIRSLIDQWNEKAPLPGVTLQVSIGIHEAGPEDIGTVLMVADEKLYREKRYRKQ
ncbi:MAG: sensor domain-containing diguanylate cyclase [Deltaproteobacteria bacterium]|nr:sensor domain-containing diguanylate cyclase [Deltaproteobacteria bacterium]